MNPTKKIVETEETNRTRFVIYQITTTNSKI